MESMLSCCVFGSSSTVVPQETSPMNVNKDEGVRPKGKPSDDVSVLSHTSGSEYQPKSLTERFSNEGNSSKVSFSKSNKSVRVNNINSSEKRSSVRQDVSKKSYVDEEDDDDDPLEAKHSKYCMCGCRSF